MEIQKEVPIAVSNQDAGSNLRGKDINIGNEIVDSLKKNKNLGWKFVDEKQAIYGVERGITMRALQSQKTSLKRLQRFWMKTHKSQNWITM